MTENEITEVVIGCAIKVHKSLGPGLLEQLLTLRFSAKTSGNSAVKKKT